MSNLFLDAQFVKAEIGKLLAAYPDLAEDELLRADMVDGETDAARIIERALDELLRAETTAEAIAIRARNLSERGSRFTRKGEAMRRLIQSVMSAAQVKKMQLTEATIYVQPPSARVEVIDANALPQGFFKRVADKTAIKAALKSGEEIPGAVLAFGEAGLRIQTK